MNKLLDEFLDEVKKKFIPVSIESVHQESGEKLIDYFWKIYGKSNFSEIRENTLLIYPAFFNLSDTSKWICSSVIPSKAKLTGNRETIEELKDYTSLSIKLIQNRKVSFISEWIIKEQNKNSNIHIQHLSLINVKSIEKIKTEKRKNRIRISVPYNNIQKASTNNKSKIITRNYSLNQVSSTVDGKNVKNINKNIYRFKSINYSLLSHIKYLSLGNVHYIFSRIYDEKGVKKGLGGFFLVLNKNLNDCEEKAYIKFYQNISDLIATKLAIKYLYKKIFDQTLKTAIISILVDSYAHNISAHSLAALKWWFEKRTAEYDKRIYIRTEEGEGIIDSLTNIQPGKITKDALEKFAILSDKYYKILGLGDSENDKHYTSLMEIVRLLIKENHQNTGKKEAQPKEKERLLTYEEGKVIDDKCINYRYPVPIDYAISKFLRFLRDKAAFWSGVTRDLPFGGEVKNLYNVLWNDFADNPLYLGTIAHSEGIDKLNIFIECPVQNFKNGDGEFLEKYSSLKKHNEYCDWGGINYIKLDFAKIDMSVIDYEKELYQKGIAASDPEPVIYNSLDPIDNTINYSKYALVYPGEDHREIREELQKSDYNVFLPGGVVGEHALFTIFENTIRNIKHFDVDKDIKTKGLNFNIRITPAKLMKKGMPALGSNDHKLFSIGVYLDHDNRLFDVKFEDNKPKLKRIKEILEEQTSKSVVDDNGSARLGGNAQDKICAAMLLNNQFISVDPKLKEKMTERDEYYNEKNNYYWIGFEDTLKEEEVKGVEKKLKEVVCKCEEKLNGESGTTIDCKDSKAKIKSLFEPYFNKNYKEKVDKILDKNKGRLMKHFHLWKGDYIYCYQTLQNLENENVSRFKFVYIDSFKENIDGTLLLKLKDNGVIRIIFEGDISNIAEEINKFFHLDDFKSIYNKNTKNNQNIFIKRLKAHKSLKDFEKYSVYLIWLRNFLEKQTFHFLRCYDRENNGEKPNSIMTIKEYEYEGASKETSDIEFYVHHSGNKYNFSDKDILIFRSHGWLREKIIKDDNFNLYTDTQNNDISSKPIFSEFVEVLSTKICIIDNRVNSRINKDYKKKYINLLGIDINSEFIMSNNEDSNKWNEITNKVRNGEYNFFVVHLSYIESLGINEKDIDVFFEKHLRFKKNKGIPENTIIVITTGRGRSKWISNLDPIYKKNTIFKPIESILSVVEDAILFKDDIQLKYNLTKILFGS